MDVIETERLVLRQQTLEDAAFILALMNDPEWLRYIGDRGVRTHEEARAYIQEGALKMYDRHGFGLYLMELKGDRTPVGICGLIKRDSLDDVDLGFALACVYRGKGYAREAAAATVAYARDIVGLRRVVAIVSPDNTDSLRLLDGLGFSFERLIDYPTGDRVNLLALAL
jgi:RimJ/RimL family protein N-acetyltransferase